jgi:hypothetical protein
MNSNKAKHFEASIRMPHREQCCSAPLLSSPVPRHVRSSKAPSYSYHPLPKSPPHRRQLTLPRLVKHTARAAYNQTKRLCPSSLPRFHLLLPVLCRETPLLRRDTHGGRDHAGGQCGRARAAPQGGETSVRGARAGVRECCADVASIFSGFLLKENRSCRSLGRRDSPSRFSICFLLPRIRDAVVISFLVRAPPHRRRIILAVSLPQNPPCCLCKCKKSFVSSITAMESPKICLFFTL